MPDLLVEHVRWPLRASVNLPTPKPEAAVEAHVDRIWQTEKARRGEALFNGHIFSVSTRLGGEISGFIAEYRWFVAQRRDPTLREYLNIRPLSVSGLLTCDEGVLIGRRGALVEQNADEWELVPSGTIDPTAIGAQGNVDFTAALETEMREEIGLDRSALSSALNAVLIVEDPANGVMDVVLHGSLAISAADVLSRHAGLTNREYREMAVVPVHAINGPQSPVFTEVSRAISVAVEMPL